MSITIHNLKLNARETKELSLQFKNIDGSVKPLPAGIDIIAEIVEKRGSSFAGPCTLVTTSRVVSFDYLINRSAGTILLSLNSIESDKLQYFIDHLEHYWNVFIVYPDGKKIKKVEGIVEISKAAR